MPPRSISMCGTVQGDSMHRPQAIAIRETRAGDFTAIAELTGQLGYPTTAAQMQVRLAGIVTDSSRATFVAEREGQIVGYAGVWYGQNYEADAPQARVMGLVVDASERRRGTGAALMQAIEEWSRERGVGVIVLNTGDGRAGAHAFYERLGYRNTARRYVKIL